ncbi:hypothetical protein [Sphingobium phenoxybenzoativorans]|uniref:hypothetical protein n=1 Tax=Sphingobium phenoxybenzoativorans TaxID=1592790 RepID=UPI000872948B|nr:hypothetical protein [Sphingobium phenoxybenzoativorans]
MYSESDLQNAVEAGAISAEAAEALRAHVSRLRASPLVDEEHFRLLTGFNDIFVTIAATILLVAVGWLGNTVRLGAADYQPSVASGLFIAAASWGLAEYFTRQRRMALPSILLLLGFAGGVTFALAALVLQVAPDPAPRAGGLLASGIALATAIAIWFHWKRFMVPITVAAGALAVAGVGIALVYAAIPRIEGALFWLVLLAGLGIFAAAMWWDMSDRGRTTRRSDVAFWLHLTAAPMIAHSMFHLLGVFDGEMGVGTAITVLLLYVAFGLVALAIDRRALLVSSLAYVLYALYALMEQAGAVELSWAFTALIIGSALLLLSALWHKARKLVVEGLPEDIRGRLPYLDREAAVKA